MASVKLGTVGAFRKSALYAEGAVNVWFNYDKGYIVLNGGRAPRRPISGSGRIHDDRR